MLEDEVLVDESGQDEIYTDSGDLGLDSDALVPEGTDANIEEPSQLNNEDQLIPDDSLDGQELSQYNDSDLLFEELEEEEGLLEEVDQAAAVADPLLAGDNVEPSTEETSETSTEESSEMESLQALVEVIQKNQKTAAENMQLIGAIQIALLAMIFGGFVIYCFLHKLW